MSQTVSKIFINRSCIHRCIRFNLFTNLKIVRIAPYLDSIQKAFYHLRIAIYRDSLITVIEIIIIVGKTQRQSLYDKCRKLRTFPAPLLLGIPLDQLLIHIRSHQTDRLLLKICRFTDPGFHDLFINDRLCFRRCLNPPHLTKRVHIKRKIVKLVPVNSNR